MLQKLKIDNILLGLGHSLLHPATIGQTARPEELCWPPDPNLWWPGHADYAGTVLLQVHPWCHQCAAHVQLSQVSQELGGKHLMTRQTLEITNIWSDKPLTWQTIDMRNPWHDRHFTWQTLEKTKTCHGITLPWQTLEMTTTKKTKTRNDKHLKR